MNDHPVEAHRVGNHYTAHYYCIWKQDKPFTVLDDEGNPVHFPSWEKATIAAYQARDEEEAARYRHWNGVDQIKPPERWYDRNTRMRAQAKEDAAKAARGLFKAEVTA